MCGWHSKRLYDEIRRQQGPEGQRGRRLTSVVLVPVGRRTRYGFTRLVADHGPGPGPATTPIRTHQRTLVPTQRPHRRLGGDPFAPTFTSYNELSFCDILVTHKISYES